MQKEEQWLLDEKYHGKSTAGFKKDLARIKAGEPLDYIIGFTEFLGCKIDLSKKPLIPRFETEYWTEQVIEELKVDKVRKVYKVLDIFSGSGAIGISIVRNVINFSSEKFKRSSNVKFQRNLYVATSKNIHMAFADSEKNCVEQIKINCKINKLKKLQYEIIRSDVFENIAGKFDIIVANPPYIPAKNKHKVQQSALDHEPHVSLFGKDDGLFYITKFLEGAPAHLEKTGTLYMEFDSHQKPAIAKLLKKYGYQQFMFHKDQYQRWRYLKAYCYPQK